MTDGKPDEKPEIDWNAIRLAYEASPEAVAEIAARFGLHRVTIHHRASRDGWVKRQPPVLRKRNHREPPETAALVDSLKRTTARLVAAMEARLGSAGEGIAEGDVRALGALAATLSKVIALNPERRPEHDDDGSGGPSLDVDDPAVLDALSERLERLAAERAARGAEGADPDGAAEAAGAVAAVRASRPDAAGG